MGCDCGDRGPAAERQPGWLKKVESPRSRVEGRKRGEGGGTRVESRTDECQTNSKGKQVLRFEKLDVWQRNSNESLRLALDPRRSTLVSFWPWTPDSRRSTFVWSLTRRLEMPTMRWRGFLRLESYMRFPVPQISICVLLVHLLVGCCWHHAHTCDVNCCNQPAATARACACSSHQTAERHGDDAREHGHGSTPAESEGDSHPHRCAGGHCTFLRSQRLAEQEADYYSHPLPCDPASLTSFDVQGMIAQSTQAFTLANQICEDGPPIRRHLLLNILVI